MQAVTERPGWYHQPRTRSALVLVVSVLSLLATAQGQAEAWAVMPSWWKPLDLVVGALAIGCLLWRRRYPVAVALVLGVVGGLFLSAAVPTLVSVWTVATSRPLRVALAVSALHLAIAVPYYLLFPVIEGGLVVWSVMLVLMYGTILSAGIAVRSRRQFIAGLVESAARDRRDFEASLDGVRRTERARIAREMHDVLAHRMSLLSMHAGALEYRTGRRDGSTRLSDDELHASVAVIRDSAHRALEELAEVLAVLHDDQGGAAPDARGGQDDLRTGPPQPVISDLPRLVAEAGAAGQAVRLRVEAGPGHLDGLRAQAHRTVYRVVQEGLTNARKHAPGSVVDVVVTASPGRAVAAMVSNPLPLGLSRDEIRSGIPGSGTGITGLRERVRIDGGLLRTDVRDGLFELSVELPWRTR